MLENVNAKLIFKSYMPKSLDKGMLFLTNVGKQLQVIKLESVPRDQELFLQENGYPVEMYIIDEGNPNIANDTKILATPEQIGWFDYDDESDEYRDIEIKDINVIFEDFGGNCQILMESLEEIDDDYEGYYSLIPYIYEDKVVVSLPQEEEEDQFFFNDDEEYTYEKEN